MAKRLFEGASHAATYAKFRPSPPETLIKRIVHFLQEKINPPFQCAVDIGCGTGQSSRVLAPYFKNVIGTDVSSNQLKEAENAKLPNIEYKIGQAETIPAQDSSVQLITASQAAHWFDLPKFYKEAQRVLEPNGVVALYGYLMPIPHFDDPNIKKNACQLMNEMYSKHLGNYWESDARKLVDSCYADIVLPFKDSVRERGMTCNVQTTLYNLIGYIRSWSAFQDFKKEDSIKAEKLMKEFENNFMSVLGSKTSAEETSVIMQFEYFLVMGRNSAS